MKNMKNFSETTIIRMKELVDLAARRNAKLTFSEDSTCVNASIPNGSFICTSCEYTLEDNLAQVIDFLRHSHIGSACAVKRPAITNLGEITGKVMKMHEASAYADEMNSLISSEFSPDTSEQDYAEIVEMLAGFGLTVQQYHDELSSRITMNYNRHCQYRA